MQYNALQTIQALEAGQVQRKAREQEAAMKGIGNALAGGNYAGASSGLFNMGNIEGGLKVAEYGKGLEDAAAEQKRVGAIRYGMGLLNTPPEQREAMRGQIGQTLGGMGWQLDENAIATMDLSDEGIKATLATLQDTDGLMKQYQSMMAPTEYGFQNVAGVGLVRTDPRGGTADVAMAAVRDPIEVNGVLVDPVTFEPVADFRTPTQTGEMTPYQREQIRLEAARLGISEAQLMLEIQKAEAAASSGASRKYEKAQDGVLRYVDTGEPVFPNVTTAKTNKPLIGAEAMARVTAGLPNAKQAVEDLDRLVFRSKGTTFSAEGYDPASDWGAATIEALPDWGLLKGVARTVGGEDYQLFKDSYGSFEAAMLPIISGAAITESEGLRQMRALEIKPGDSEQTRTRKLAGMRAMVQGVEMAARGDTEGFIGMLDRAGEISGAGPVKRSGTAASGAVAPEFEGYTLDGEPITEDDIQTTMRENNMTRAQVVAALKGGAQ